MIDDDELMRLQRLAHVGQLGAGVVHEARNVLTGVLGYAELAQERIDDPATLRDQLRVVAAETRRALDILTSYLSLGRLSRGTGPVDLNAVATETAGLVRHAFRLVDVSVATELAPEPIDVVGDAGALRQVLLNLALNAAQAMPDGGQVRLTTGREHGEVVLRVLDDGPGIPADLRERIFSPFFTTKQAGTGLGLAISCAIVAEHGGRLALEPSERGAVFAIRLPSGDGP